METRINNIIIEEITIGDIIHETALGVVIESKVSTKPILKDGAYTWTSICLDGTNSEIIYLVNTAYMHYAPNIYKI